MSQFINPNNIKLAIALFFCSSFICANADILDSVNIDADQTNLSQWQFSDGVSNISSSLISVANDPNRFITGDTYLNSVSSSMDPNFTGFWIANFDFNISNLDATQATSITINNFSADDRAEILLNGQLIDAVSILGPTAPQIGIYPQPVFESVYTSDPTTANYVPTSFNAENSSLSLNLSNLFNGTNDLQVIINNSDNGAIGVTRPTSPGDATSFGLSGEIQYYVTTVPAPSPIVLFGTGLLSFLTLRYRKKY